ncbi:cell envelope biogenesis protein OmpA [Paucihalobacter ruber]|uniref:Cell envelope biogenesis protein OmpA n=1 Tax=Paucihalobacter ruber TaxID=2567861 RepID=A0A506PNG3_9FLAO|nr:OmpA family protein [Paucihalobacter ruber]TPV34822.1 cell envelope biogenesis protein OmpA [Paucihalobacter ruber]
MKKINNIILFVALFSFLNLIAQNEATSKADQHFSRLEFVEAAKQYNKLIEKGKGDNYVYSQLAECYYNIFNTVEAERWYAKALAGSDDPEMMFKYSQMLKSNGKYKQSNEWMQRFAEKRPNDVRAIAFLENPNYLPKILERGKKFNIKNLDINSESSDFGGIIHEGVFYFTTARNQDRRKYGWNQESFLDIYAATQNSDGSFQTPVKMNDKINTRHHEGLVSFSPDGKAMYFGRESFYEQVFMRDSTTRDKAGVIHLFRATKLGADWDRIEALNINSENYSVKNPSVSADGKTLYFASDMPGGYGSFDIYKAAINDDGSIGTPVNMGPKVNTVVQEMFPFISSNGTLYFSSNGHLGLGGLDVFYTIEIDGEMADVRNVGVPVNSNSDDFAFIIDEEAEIGYVSSNRAGGKGSDDIYAIKKIQPLCDVLVQVTVKDDETGKPISNATVSLFDAAGNKVLSKQTNEQGLTEFLVECDTNNAVDAVAEGYSGKRLQIPSTRKEEISMNINLLPLDDLIELSKIKLDPIYFDFDKSNITEKAAFELDKLVALMNKYPQMTIRVESHTDNKGSDAYNNKLSDRRAKSTVQYVISKGINEDRILGIGKGKSELKIKCGTNCTKEQNQENRRSEFIITSGNPKE